MLEIILEALCGPAQAFIDECIVVIDDAAYFPFDCLSDFIQLLVDMAFKTFITVQILAGVQIFFCALGLAGIVFLIKAFRYKIHRVDQG